jgi:glutathione synthase/RimK-type ligase-like ATP-grasp enzyme
VSSTLRLGLIGNLENRRITGFAEAVESLGSQPPVLVGWNQVIQWLAEHPESRELGPFPCPVQSVRLDSPGEDAEVADTLITLGGGPPQPRLRFGEIAWLREAHLGFAGVLKQLEETGLDFLNGPRDIAVMFDKWQCHERFRGAGVERPRATMAPGSWSSFVERIRESDSGALFLKPLHGSSASGVCAFRWASGRYQLIAPIEMVRDEDGIVLFNTLRIRTYNSPSDIETLLGRLLPQGMIAEEWIPKAALDGQNFDLRILVIAGRARHWVIRQSRSPLTNLHLGNQRGNKEAFLKQFGETVLEQCRHLAEQATLCFPSCLYAGVDILLDKQSRALVGEINAFGDLIPNLVHEGQSAYEAIFSAWRDRTLIHHRSKESMTSVA